MTSVPPSCRLARRWPRCSIKERLSLTDRETVEAIRENPFLQFFIGLEEFTQDKPFDASLMVDFRKRFGEAGLQQLTEAIALAALPRNESTEVHTEADNNERDNTTEHDAVEQNAAEQTNDASSNDASSDTAPLRGKLIVDATCAPADIRYPTDVSLLNEAREKTDAIIDKLHEPLVGKARDRGPIASKHVASSSRSSSGSNRASRRFAVPRRDNLDF